ncbi:ChrR family anti-sigma-E factor [Shewanella colwelliana]|uniref:ChrR family anti-sigma-E factor n=1 Tax=Shewanella colwelliana TaxID=23 RepID=UPI003CFBDB59
MIKHHPTQALLKDFVSGDLEASVAVLVASHVEMCAVCRGAVQALTEQAADEAFAAVSGMQSSTGYVDLMGSFDPAENLADNFVAEEAFSGQGNGCGDGSALAMIDAITETPQDVRIVLPQTVTEIEVAGKRISLPRSLKSIALKEWQGMGKLSRARLALDDDERRMSLLHIDKGGSVPTHTHKGFEITLLLEGSFDDEMGHYVAGDFIWLDGEHTHQPVTQDGCVCLTVSSDAIHFTQGVSQILNPIGRFIY